MSSFTLVQSGMVILGQPYNVARRSLFRFVYELVVVVQAHQVRLVHIRGGLLTPALTLVVAAVTFGSDPGSLLVRGFG